MAYDVITHGGGEGLVYVFNAVAALFNGKKALAFSIVYMASSFAVVGSNRLRLRSVYCKVAFKSLPPVYKPGGLIHACIAVI